MNAEQLLRNELRLIAGVFASQDESATRAIVDELKPETRAGLHRLAGDLHAMLAPKAGTADGSRIVDAGLPGGSVVATGDEEDPNAPDDVPLTAADAGIPVPNR